jgi:hypothetical protein
MPEYVPQWIAAPETPKTHSDATAKTDKSPSVSFDSAPSSRLERNTRVDAAALGLDPALQWVHVYRGPVEETSPPADWDGTLPGDCGTPALCVRLGPCPGAQQTGVCSLATEGGH